MVAQFLVAASPVDTELRVALQCEGLMEMTTEPAAPKLNQRMELVHVRCRSVEFQYCGVEREGSSHMLQVLEIWSRYKPTQLTASSHSRGRKDLVSQGPFGEIQSDY